MTSRRTYCPRCGAGLSETDFEGSEGLYSVQFLAEITVTFGNTLANFLSKITIIFAIVTLSDAATPNGCQ